MVHARLLNAATGECLAEADFDDPQDALRFIWDAAEGADHDAGPLVGEVDGQGVIL